MMSFFSSLTQFSIKKIIPVLFPVCNYYTTKKPLETVSAIPAEASTPSTAHSRGKAYQNAVAEQLRKTLNTFGFQVIDNTDKSNNKEDYSPIDILIKNNSGVTIGVEIKDSDAMSFGTTTLVFFDHDQAVETLNDFNKWPEEAQQKAMQIIEDEKENRQSQQMLTLSNVLANETDNAWLHWISCSHLLQRLSRGYCLTTKSLNNLAQQELWSQVFAANYPRWIKTRNDVLIDAAHPGFMARQRLNSSIFGGEQFPFKQEDMTLRSWRNFVEDNHLYQNQRFLLPDTPTSTTNLTGPDILRTFYRNAGASYIQIRNKGLFHLGHDMLNLGVPLFNPVNCGCHIYLRVQKDTNVSTPTSIFNGSATIALCADTVMFRQNLEPSPYSLDGDGGFQQPAINSSSYFDVVKRFKKINLLKSLTAVDPIKIVEPQKKKYKKNKNTR